MHITSIKKVDFLTHYDYNTNKYELILGDNQPDLFISCGATAHFKYSPGKGALYRDCKIR
ncbi:MAG TPA: hypothetical protein VIX20_10480, partial [Ktedonobacteraceae bacterium]